VVRGQTMVSRSLISVKDKPSEPELEGNIRKLASANAAAWQSEREDAQIPTGNLGSMLGEVSKASMEEIDRLISELQTLRRKLQTDGERIERDITTYAELSQQVMQITTIITDSVKKLPGSLGSNQ
jgi:hypothetical protein